MSDYEDYEDYEQDERKERKIGSCPKKFKVKVGKERDYQKDYRRQLRENKIKKQFAD